MSDRLDAGLGWPKIDLAPSAPNLFCAFFSLGFPHYPIRVIRSGAVSVVQMKIPRNELHLVDTPALATKKPPPSSSFRVLTCHDHD